MPSKITITDKEWEKVSSIYNDLTNQKKLYIPDFLKDFKLFVDASDIGCGSVLCQEEGVVGYSSYKFNDNEKRWSTPEKETFAILKAVKSFSNWILMSKISVFTDNKNSTYRTYNFNKKTERWKGYLTEYNIAFYHVKGTDNSVADYLSRKNTQEIETNQTKINNIEIQTYSVIPFDYCTFIKNFHIIHGHPGISKTIETLREISNLNPTRITIIKK